MEVLYILVPSWWEVQVSVVAAAVVVLSYWFFSLDGVGTGGVDDGDQGVLMGQVNGDPLTNSSYLIKVELLAAKNLVGANPNGELDTYAIITCGTEKRLSSIVAGSRNPIWAEDFCFSVNEIQVKIIATICSLDKTRKSSVQGYVEIPVEPEGQTCAKWFTLNNGPGQVCVRTRIIKCLMQSSSYRSLNYYAGTNSPRTTSDVKGPIYPHEKLGPLQTIFDLAPLEVVEHSYSCALERSFLYHGRMYISAGHICFQSTIFSKQMKVTISIRDVDEVRRSQHALINPGITIILREGARGHDASPCGNSDGRIRYKFASFWNRNHALKTLQRALKNYQATLEAERKEKLLLDVNIDPGRASEVQPMISEETMIETRMFKPFIKEDILSPLHNDVFPCTADQFFRYFLDDGSTLTSKHRASRNDTDLTIGQWHNADEYDGLIRELSYKTLCNSPMCPPYTAITESQHVTLSADKRTLVFESVQQAHDIPFATYFNVHYRWLMETKSESTCSIDIKFGTNFRKWCLFQSKIKEGTASSLTKDFTAFLDMARAYVKSKNSRNVIENTPNIDQGRRDQLLLLKSKPE